MLENLTLNLLKSFRPSFSSHFLRSTFSSLSFAEQMEQVIDNMADKRAESAEKRQERKQFKKERYNGKFKRRDWKPETEEAKKARLEAAAERGEVFERVKRKKCAVLLGYSGVNYYGMQRNIGMATIEDELMKAMLKHKWIDQEVFDRPQQGMFQRCARTDKGVSAARQLVSLKIPDPSELNIEDLNKDLPEDIRVFGVVRTTQGFNSKQNCDARSYSYTLPTYTFVKNGEAFEEPLFRLSPERIEELNNLLQLYVGTRNYHNFTIKKQPWDPSAKRHMMSFVTDPPFVPDNCEVEFIRLKVTGQSFMLHQIRRMVGLVIAVMRGNMNVGFFDNVFSQERYLIPQAPGLGLVLNNVHFTRYDKRYGDDGQHKPLTFEECDEAVEKFFRAKILPTIIKTELEEKSMQIWVGRRLNRHNFEMNAEADEEDKEEDGASSDDE